MNNNCIYPKVKDRYNRFFPPVDGTYLFETRSQSWTEEYKNGQWTVISSLFDQEEEIIYFSLVY